MDAYDLYQRLKIIWASMSPKNSGELSKCNSPIMACVLTENGYKKVIRVRENELGFIELELEK